MSPAHRRRRDDKQQRKNEKPDCQVFAECLQRALGPAGSQKDEITQDDHNGRPDKNSREQHESSPVNAVAIGARFAELIRLLPQQSLRQKRRTDKNRDGLPNQPVGQPGVRTFMLSRDVLGSYIGVQDAKRPT